MELQPLYLLALVLAMAIGFSLALLGSGGSIITLPVLVYGALVPPTVPRRRAISACLYGAAVPLTE